VKRYARVGLAIFAALALLMIGRAARLSSKQPAVAALADPPLDADGVARILGKAIERPTISESPTSLAPAAELEGLRAHLAASFPKVHATLQREVVGDSLLFTWKGASARKPIILCAHQDVVPIEPGTEGKWRKPPFSGAIEDGFVWGRGAVDDKGSLVAILAAVESLLAEGFSPERTVLLAFGHDEEVSGKTGAAKIVDLFAARGIAAEAVLDEGNPMVSGIVPNVKAPVAPIGVAEKGYFTVRLSVDMPGGHSSTPAAESSVSVLLAALARIRAAPIPARLDGATAAFFDWLTPEMPFGPRLALANTWLTWPLVRRSFARSAALDASLRTTTALTVVKAGVKDNVVPRTAEALINFRVLPGDTTAAIQAHLVRAIGDARVTLTPLEASRAEPTAVSRSDSRFFHAIATAVREVFPGTIVAPALFLGATDGRQYARVAEDVYRFQPILMTSEDLPRIHGTDERVAIRSLGDAVRFYRRFLRLAAKD
jgi:carboxypeptidase PM20D1